MKVWTLFQFNNIYFRLHDQVNERAFELKSKIDNCFWDINKKLYEKKSAIIQSKEKNIYHDKLIRTLCNHNKLVEVVKISQ